MSGTWPDVVESLWLQLAEELDIENSFGRTQLRFPVSNYGRLLTRMTRRLHGMAVESPSGDIIYPLRSLRLADEDSWVQSLLEAWALVGHVLGFYQERIANEGYLATAERPVSVQELLRMVDYRPFPGIAASALPAFLVSGAPAMPVPVPAPKGARIQGVPLGNELPQVFETVRALDGRAEWNRMAAWVDELSILPPNRGGDHRITLAGYASLKAGDVLLLRTATESLIQVVDKTSRRKAESRRSGGAKLPARRPLTGFQEAATDVTFTEPLDAAAADRRLLVREVFEFQARAHLFGAGAPSWSKLSDAVRRDYAEIRGGVRGSQDDGASWRPVNDGLPEVAVHCLLTAGPHLFAGTNKGLYRRSTDSPDAGWSLLQGGLGRLDLTVLAAPEGDREGREIFVGSGKGQIYHSTDGGDSWAPIQGRQTAPSSGIRSQLSKLWHRATAPLHLKPSPPLRANLPSGPVHALLAVSLDGAPHLLAGTDQGVFRFRLPSAGWRASSRGLPGEDPASGQTTTPVRALIAEPGGGLLLGCKHGIFRSRDGGERWHPSMRGLSTQTASKVAVEVYALTGYTDTRGRRTTLFAGTSHGVYRRDQADGVWSAASLGLIDPAPDASGPPAVTHLASRLDPRDLSHHVFAGTSAGLFRSSDRGASWGRVASLRTELDILALAAGGSGQLFAAQPFDGFAEQEWPGFHLQPGVIDLDRVYTSALEGGWVVLRQPPSVGGVLEAAFRIRAVTRVKRQDFELSATVSRLFVEDDGTLETFDLRATTALVGSRALALWRRRMPDLHPVRGSEVRVAPALAPPPESGRRMIVTGKRSRVRLADGAWGQLERLQGRRSRQLLPEPKESLQVLRWNPLEKGHGMLVQDRFGRRLRLKTEGDLQWLAAAEDDEVVGTAVETLEPGTRREKLEEAKEANSKLEAELHTTRTSSAAQEGVDFTTLNLTEALGLVLDPSTVQVWGNVTEANQGQTLTQAIGSGDASEPLQRFSLGRPLTYVAASNAEGYRSTLRVEVAGGEWTQVSHLAEVDGSAHAFMVRPDLSGLPTVIFGDGVHGARLPTGRQNVIATYRTGMWAESLAPRQLSNLQTRPLGLRRAENPLATEAGATPEAPETSRRRMPSWIRPLRRIVSLTDYQDFVRQHAGIAKALVAPLAPGGRPFVHITMASQDGERLDPRGELYRTLLESIETHRSPGDPIRLENYEPVHWLIGLRLRAEDASQISQIADLVRGEIRRRYAFENSEFGGRVYVGQVVELAARVPGVVGAEATLFGVTAVGWRQSEAPEEHEAVPVPDGVLQAHLARVDGGATHPAQLLVMDERSPSLEVTA